MENHPDLKKALELIGDKWSLLILSNLKNVSSLRFTDCQKADGINTKTLSQRLAALENAGLIVKHEYNEYPPRTEYELTDKGRALAPVFESLSTWAQKHL